MRGAFESAGLACDTRVVTIDDAGARWHALDPDTWEAW
jgi:hypothetical protein